MSLRSPAENEMGKSHYTATSKIVTPERFNRGASPKCSGFPLRHAGMTDLQSATMARLTGFSKEHSKPEACDSRFTF